MTNTALKAARRPHGTVTVNPPPPAGPPTVPINLRSTGTTTTTVNLACDASSADEADPVQGYRWFRNTGGTAFADTAGTTTTDTGRTAATQYTYEVLAYNTAGSSARSAPISVTTASAAGSLFAGHIPNRVLVGMAAAEGLRPTFQESLDDHIQQPVYERRKFESGNYTANWLNNELADAIAGNYYPVLSFKYANWLQISQGAEDVDLTAIRNKAKTMRAGGAGVGVGNPAKPFAMGIHHEPEGDGVLTEWASMQIYCSNFFAGWDTTAAGAKVAGSYVAANDVSDIMAWCAIHNGHFWGPKAANYDTTAINAGFPPHLVRAFAENRSILMADFYDPTPSNKATVIDPDRETPPFTFVANADRTSLKIGSFINWARFGHPPSTTPRAGGVPALGCGEFSAATAVEVTAAWVVMRQNRDVWAISNYFNSFNNSRWYWRVIPDSYPAFNPDNGNPITLRDYGGSPESAAKLARFKTMLTESATIYT